MSRITIGIVADMRRQREAFYLGGEIKTDILSYDDGLLGCTKNHLKVWTKVAQKGGDWAVVLEDDAVPVDDFRTKLAVALEDPPADVVGLYLGTGYPREWQRFVKPAVAAQEDWILSSHLLHGVGTAIRMPLVHDMLRFVGNMSEQDKLWAVDAQITHWCRLRGLRVAYTNPSLVDHKDEGTLVGVAGVHPDGGKRTHPRKAYQVGALESYRRSSVYEMP